MTNKLMNTSFIFCSTFVIALLWAFEGMASVELEQLRNPAENWCIRDQANPPCGGERGRCTKNENGLMGGFVADSARVEEVRVRSWIFWNEQRNSPVIHRYAQVCGGARVAGYSEIKENVVLEGGRTILVDKIVESGVKIENGVITRVETRRGAARRSGVGAIGGMGALLGEERDDYRAVRIPLENEAEAHPYLRETDPFIDLLEVVMERYSEFERWQQLGIIVEHVSSVSRAKLGEEDAKNRCVVCLEELGEDPEKELGCMKNCPKHIQHMSCLKKWLLEKRECAVCRAPLTR